MKKLFFITLLLGCFTLSAQDSLATDSVITIGIKQSPPFINLNEAGTPSGLSVDFWELIDQELDARVEYKTYTELPALLKGLQKGEVDMSINPITVTDQRMEFLDFSQPFYISGTAMVRQKSSSWLSFLKNLFSYKFLSAAAILLAVIFIFGLLIWIFERRANPDQFGKGLTGVADGFWWSAVTMTTVGYGDKAPISRGGRVVGFIWMFAAILMISGLTAGIASALTVSNLESNIDSVEDLRRFKTGTVQNSSSANYLRLFGVAPQTFHSVSEGLDAVKSGEIKVFVYDRPILQYNLKKRPEDELQLVKKDLKTDYYSFSFPKGSPLRNALDPKVVKALKSERWNYQLRADE